MALIILHGEFPEKGTPHFPVQVRNMFRVAEISESRESKFISAEPTSHSRRGTRINKVSGSIRILTYSHIINEDLRIYKNIIVANLFTTAY